MKNQKELAVVVMEAVKAGFGVDLCAKPRPEKQWRPRRGNRLMNEARAAYALLRMELEPKLKIRPLAEEMGRTVSYVNYWVMRGMEMVTTDKCFAKKMRVALGALKEVAGGR